MSDRIWNSKIECASRDEIRAIQDERLAKLVRHVYDNVPFYRKKMDARGVRPEDIRTAQDVTLLPFTEKSDLRDNYPFGLVAVPRTDIVRLHASSGTTGKPTVAAYTQGDVDAWAEMAARALYSAGVTQDSVVHVAYGYGLFTGGFGVHYGAELIGASVVPASGGNTQRQLTLIEDFGATALCCTPSYAINLAEALLEKGVDMRNIQLNCGVFGAEPWSESMRARIQDMLHIDARDIYGLTEMMGPGVAMECAAKQGLHIWEDGFLPEVLDEYGKPVPDGQTGELVITTLVKRGMPLLRYRTHDLTALTHEKCACGRTHARMRRVTGRNDDMLIIRGVNVFPSQIEQTLLAIAGITSNYQIVVDRHGSLDELTVNVELDPQNMSDTVRDVEGLRNRVVNELSAACLVHARVKLCPAGSLPRSEGKAKRVIDNRTI